MKTHALSVATAALAFLVSASALAATEARPEKSFKRVQMSGAADVKVTKGASFSVSVTSDDAKLIKWTKTRVEGDELIISTDEHDSGLFSKKVTVNVTMPELRAYQLTGAGNSDVSGFAGSDLELKATGAGNIRYSGSANDLKVDLSGSGAVDLSNGSARKLRVDVGGAGNVTAKGFAAHDADVDLSGTGNVDVTVNDGTLNAHMSGVGHIVWRGTGKLGSSDSSGVGSISHR